MVKDKDKADKSSIWTSAMSLQLLEEFRKKDELWDPNNPYYFNTKQKEKAWDALSEAMGQSTFECRRKMESLKGSYRRERSRANRSRRGIGKGPYNSKWFAFDAMKFLDERPDPRACYSNPPPELFGELKLVAVGDKEELVRFNLIERTEDKDPYWESTKLEHESDVDLDDDDDTPINCEPFPLVTVDGPILQPYETVNNQQPSFGEIPEEQNPVTISVPSSPSDNYPVDITEAPTIQANQSPRREERQSDCVCRDECTTYGQHVANKLRKLDDKSRALVQHKINSLLFKAEMKMFDGDENI